MTDLTLIQGDDAIYDVIVTEDGVAVPLDTIQWAAFTAKRSVRDTDEEALLRKDLGAGITNDADGLHLSFDSADTRDLVAPVGLVWDVMIRDSGGRVHTVAGGNLYLLADVTREPGDAPGSGAS
jgi:hypothetical protein